MILEKGYIGYVGGDYVQVIIADEEYAVVAPYDVNKRSTDFTRLSCYSNLDEHKYLMRLGQCDGNCSM